MSTTQQTPPTPPAPPAPPASSTPRVIAILAIVLGALVVLGSIGSTVSTTLAAASVRTETQRVDVAGVTALDASVDAGSLRVEYGAVDRAVLKVTSGGGRGSWTLTRDGDTLTVRTPSGPWWSWWGGGWFGARGGPSSAVLQLPQSLAGMDASLDLSAGQLTAEGRYGSLKVTTSAGKLVVNGSADTIDTRVSAGQADLALTDVRHGTLELSAGQLDATFGGVPPQQLSLNASAGAMNVTVPRGDYDVTSHTSAGSFRNLVGSTPGASSTVSVDVSAGQIVLQPGG